MSKKQTIYGKNPITLENIDVKEWLAESPDNILLIIEKNLKKLGSSRSDSRKKLAIPDMIYCIQRSFLQTPSLKHIYVKCVLKNNALMVNDMFRDKTTLFHLGYYLNKSLLIDEKDLNSKIIEKNNIFKISLTNENFEDFISKEALALSNFGLAKKPSFKVSKTLPKLEQDRLKKLYKEDSKKDLLTDKKNIPYKKDVYFETILAKALRDYSYQWDAPVNLYLRQGESYFQTSIFKTYFKRYGPTIEEAERAVKQKTEDLDRAFMEAAPRNQKHEVYFRGMQMPFSGLKALGDTDIISNFISVSTSLDIALKFSGIPKGRLCCIYKLIVEKGVPLIDMANTTEYKHEREVLLPRNLLYTVRHIEYIGGAKFKVPILTLQVGLRYPEQFKVTTGCKKFLVGKLSPFKPSYISMAEVEKKIKEDYPVAKDSNGKPIDIEKEIKDDVQNHTVPLVGKKCPKGYRFNKTISLCEFNDPNKPKAKPKAKAAKTTAKAAKPKKTKQTLKDTKGMKRCAKGTRRSKITGNCEPYP